MSFLAPKPPAVNVPPPPQPFGQIQGQKPGTKATTPTVLSGNVRPSGGLLGAEQLASGAPQNKTFLGQ